MPNTGPSDGCRIAAIVEQPIRLRAIESPIVIVVLPSPSGVGVIAVTSMYLPLGRPARRFITDSVTLALCLPYSSSSSSSMPRAAATSAMGSRRARCAISRSESMEGSLSRRDVEDVSGLADRLDANGADLVFGNLRRGVECRVGQEVGGGVGELYERDEDRALPYRFG